MDDTRIIPHPIAQAIASLRDELLDQALADREAGGDHTHTALTPGQLPNVRDAEIAASDVAMARAALRERIAAALPHLGHISNTPPRRLFGCLYLPEPVHALICLLPPRDRRPVPGLLDTSQCQGCGCYVQTVSQ